MKPGPVDPRAPRSRLPMRYRCGCVKRETMAQVRFLDSVAAIGVREEVRFDYVCPVCGAVSTSKPLPLAIHLANRQRERARWTRKGDSMGAEPSDYCGLAARLTRAMCSRPEGWQHMVTVDRCICADAPHAPTGPRRLGPWRIGVEFYTHGSPTLFLCHACTPDLWTEIKATFRRTVTT